MLKIELAGKWPATVIALVASLVFCSIAHADGTSVDDLGFDLPDLSVQARRVSPAGILSRSVRAQNSFVNPPAEFTPSNSFCFPVFFQIMRTDVDQRGTNFEISQKDGLWQFRAGNGKSQNIVDVRCFRPTVPSTQQASIFRNAVLHPLAKLGAGDDISHRDLGKFTVVSARDFRALDGSNIKTTDFRQLGYGACSQISSLPDGNGTRNGFLGFWSPEYGYVSFDLRVNPQGDGAEIYALDHNGRMAQEITPPNGTVVSLTKVFCQVR